MAAKILTGKKYFYALGQKCRAKGIGKEAGIALFRVDAALPYASIAFDAGFRGLAI